MKQWYALYHDDVIKWKHFPRYWPFVRGIHRSPVNSPHKGQWRGALMFTLICARINGWVNNREAGDLRRHSAHSDVIVMMSLYILTGMGWPIILQESSRLCNWLSLRCLVPWINHLPPVCWSTFGILVWNDSGYVNLTQWWYFFIIFQYILHISTPHIMIFCFPLPYFPLSTSALFFA